ncbi:MAG: AIR synthase, partial [Candidatus Aenigmatarchaeota archaeon]
KADEVVRRLFDKGIRSSIVGEILPREEGVHIIEGGVKRRLDHPKVDPFWSAFERELRRTEDANL